MQLLWLIVRGFLHLSCLGQQWLVKLVFKHKFHADGTFQRCKARLVEKDLHQVEGLDYHETFSPVVKPTTVHVVLTKALSSR